MKQRIEDSADRLLRELLSRHTFFGARDFPAHPPVSTVADLVGLEEYGDG